MKFIYYKLLDFLFGPLIIEVDLTAEAVRTLPPANDWDSPITLMENAHVVAIREWREGGILKRKRA